MLSVKTGNLLYIISFSIGIFLLMGCGRAGSNLTVEDIDGNVYSTVKIGKQIWMAENLRVRHFRDGEAIPHVVDSDAWYMANRPAYCWYENDSAGYNDSYGVLYNYYAINSENLCPEGWRIPDKEDFYQLLEFLDPETDRIRHEASKIAGGILKSTNFGANNQGEGKEPLRGFNALPGGCRSYGGNFSMGGMIGYYGAIPGESSLALRNSTESAFVRDQISGYVGVSVRCLKND